MSVYVKKAVRTTVSYSSDEIQKKDNNMNLSVYISLTNIGNMFRYISTHVIAFQERLHGCKSKCRFHG